MTSHKRATITWSFTLLALTALAAGCTGQKTSEQGGASTRKTTARRGGAVMEPSDKVSHLVSESEGHKVPRPYTTKRRSNTTSHGAGGSLEKPVEPLPEEEDLPPAAIAEVVLSEQHAKSNRVNVGDPFPDLKLTTLDGAVDAVSAHLGKRGTVVFFWKGDNLYALQELGDLFHDIVRRYAHEGINVVGVNVGDSSAEAKLHIDAADAKFSQLRDPDGSALAELATAYVPRTYLLDGNGKILWFDLEYSPTTRHRLRDGVRKLVAGQQEGQ